MYPDYASPNYIIQKPISPAYTRHLQEKQDMDILEWVIKRLRLVDYGMSAYHQSHATNAAFLNMT